MHRIDTPTADINNRFIEGDPQTAVPATELSAEWFNDVQENLAQFIEAQGIALEKGNWTKLTQAINAASSTFSEVTPKKTILNNQAAFVNLVGVVYDKTLVKAVSHEYVIDRSTADIQLLERGEFTVAVKNGVWTLILGIPRNDDSGVEFDVDALTGQVKYKSTALAGVNYAGNIYLKPLIFKL